MLCVNPVDPLDMSGRAVLVTGGTRGIGRATATRFLKAGADVYVCARHRPDEPVTAADREADFVSADVRDHDEVSELIRVVTERAGRLDVLVNNAGGAPPAAAATASPRFSEKVVALNLLAPLALAQAVHPIMTSQPDGGVIVNVASVSGTRPNPSGAAYGAAKAGLLNLTETLAHEWGPAIRVVAVIVGFVATAEAHLFYGDEEGIAAVGGTVPLKRLAEPAEIADVVLFLASPLASYVSGAAVPVHGGGERPSYLSASSGDVRTLYDSGPDA